MSWIFSKFLKDKATNRDIRMGNQLEHGGVIAQTNSLAVVDEPITFTSTVDFTDATVVGLPFYSTEIEAIDAGLAFGDKYVDSDGVVQTVTKIKQTITLAAGVQTAFGFLIDLDTLSSKNITTVFSGFAGTIVSETSGNTVLFLSSNPGFSSLTAFANGKGYIAQATTTYTVTFYEAPVNTGYHAGLVNGINYVVHNSETTTAANAKSWIGLTITSVGTYTDGALVNEPATWTKGQAYVVTTSTGPQAAIGSPSTSIPIDITGEQIVDLLTAENYDSRPYKVYTALLTQTGTDAPVAIVLENTLDGTIIWTRTTDGIYVGTLAGAFVTNKTFVNANTIYDDGGFITRINITHTTDAVTIGNAGGVDFSWPGAMINGTNYPIEIRVYD